MPASASDKLLIDRIEANFTYHPPTGRKAESYVQLRQTAKGLALLIVDLCPDGLERSSALAKLEECVMWANASIARNI